MRSVFVSWFVLLLALSGCDGNRVFDENKSIDKNQWHYKTLMPFDVQIKDTQKLYNILVNLRVDANYKYSNIFMWLHTTQPDKKHEQVRVEIKLADETGKWLGSGLGDLYDYQFPVYQKIKFNQPGFYRFELEQNMRDDTLNYVKSAGVRIEKIEQ